jgi:hypothetical protein
MSTHIFDELPLLLTGEADRATVALAADHLRECEDCQQELVSALIAHASLSSAARFAPELRSLLSTDDAEDRPAEPADLPDLTPIFEMAKQEARAPRHSVVPPRARSRRARWIAVAAVAGVLVGGGIGEAGREQRGPGGREFPSGTRNGQKLRGVAYRHRSQEPAAGGMDRLERPDEAADAVVASRKVHKHRGECAGRRSGV